MKVPGRPQSRTPTPAALPDQPFMLMAAAHMAQQGGLLNTPAVAPSNALTPTPSLSNGPAV